MARLIVGTLKLDADPGTIVGPAGIGDEYLVVLSCDAGVTSFGYATIHEIEAARSAPEPRSLTEIRLRGQGSR